MKYVILRIGSFLLLVVLAAFSVYTLRGKVLSSGTPAEDPLAAARLAAAKVEDQAAWDWYQNGTIVLPQYSQASIHLMESEYDIASDPAGRVAARLGQRDRMRRLLASEEIRSGTDHGVGFPGLKAAQYYVAEAEWRLAREKAGR